jgi:5-methyltetrahydrofolate--homocysteine methyltransferase
MDLDAVLKVVRAYRQATALPILVRPNAGSDRVGDRWHYQLTPARFAERIPELVEAGATLIGGCCGTTPEHIAAARAVLEGMGVLWKPT